MYLEAVYECDKCAMRGIVDDIDWELFDTENKCILTTTSLHIPIPEGWDLACTTPGCTSVLCTTCVRELKVHTEKEYTCRECAGDKEKPESTQPWIDVTDIEVE